MNLVIHEDDLVYACLSAVAMAKHWERTRDGDFDKVMRSMLFVRSVITELPINVQKALWEEIKILDAKL